MGKVMAQDSRCVQTAADAMKHTHPLTAAVADEAACWLSVTLGSCGKAAMLILTVLPARNDQEGSRE
jgi:hypothetical protein